MPRILLGQLTSNGDCLYATILARQIKRDYPGAHLTWAISSLCAGMIRGNPDVDDVWEVPMSGWEYEEILWRVFEREALRRVLRGEFDHAFLSQIMPNNYRNYDGTIRPSILRNYGKPITVSIENVLALGSEERANVEAFAKDTHLDDHPHRILFECSCKSHQSFITPDLAQEVAEHVYAALPDATVIFTTHLPMVLRHRQSRYAGRLSLREVAGLTHHCTLFVGAGSGGTVVASSTASRRLPTIQLLRGSTSVFASIKHDFEYFGLPADHVLEMTREAPADIAAAIVVACREGMASAQPRFEDRIAPRFGFYRDSIRAMLLDRSRYIEALESLKVTVSRYGPVPELREFGRSEIAPNLARDPDWFFAHRRDTARSILAELGLE